MKTLTKIFCFLLALNILGACANPNDVAKLKSSSRDGVPDKSYEIPSGADNAQVENPSVNPIDANPPPAVVPIVAPPPSAVAPVAENPPSVVEAAPDKTNETTTDTQEIVLSEASNLRTLKNDVLEVLANIPAGSKIRVPTNQQPVNYNYLDNGQKKFSSTGFFSGIRLISANGASWSQEKIDNINTTATGVYISATIAGQIGDPGSMYKALLPATPGSEFLRVYKSNGQPLKSFTASVKKRFPNLNKTTRFEDLSGADQTKWTRIMKELQNAADRTVATPKSYLLIDTKVAVQASIDFEKTGRVSPWGAWSVAVQGTAKRHGFDNVPCAEFMSELIRQAYARAGYSHTQDFNAKNSNVLSYANQAAAVVNLSQYLYRAGWTAWDPSTYEPPTGAIMMHASGTSPGHTYAIAGDSGRFIVDNGSPKGRDLRMTSQRILDMMFLHGVFFTPPGFQPKKWATP